MGEVRQRWYGSDRGVRTLLSAKRSALVIPAVLVGSQQLQRLRSIISTLIWYHFARAVDRSLIMCSSLCPVRSWQVDMPKHERR